MKSNYRIVKFDHTTKEYHIKYAGTDDPSWLTLEQARERVDRDNGEMVYEYSEVTGRPVGEIC